MYHALYVMPTMHTILDAKHALNAAHTTHTPYAIPHNIHKTTCTTATVHYNPYPTTSCIECTWVAEGRRTGM